MKTTIGLLVLFFAVLGGGYALYAHNQAALIEDSASSPAMTADTATTSTNTEPATSGTVTTGSNPSTGTVKPTPTPTPAPGTYTSSQVAVHNTSSSCWTIVNGGVYDLTAWIKQHPGGQGAILSLCGHDGTKSFEAQHGGQARPEQELASFKVGTLAS